MALQPAFSLPLRYSSLPVPHREDIKGVVEASMTSICVPHGEDMSIVEGRVNTPVAQPLIPQVGSRRACVCACGFLCVYLYMYIYIQSEALWGHILGYWLG